MNIQPMMSTSQSISIINGHMTREVTMTYSYILQPKQKGKLTIEPARINVEGQTLETKAIDIIVGDAVKTPENPNDPHYLAEQNVHLVAHISNRRPYVGEAVAVEYRLYTKNVSLGSVSNYEKPKYEGFWSQAIEHDGEWKKGTFKGEAYEYAVLEKALLIPTKAGKLYIDELSLDAVVGIPIRRRNFFGEVVTYVGNRVQSSYASTKQLINVQPLPVNAPEGFNGAVGDFKYSVSLSKGDLKANESSRIKVKVSGTGNLNSFKLPRLVTPPELEVYTPERKENIHTKYNGLQGSLSETYTVVPQYKGKYKIPSTAFVYFNPKDKKYHTINSEELIVNVLEGKELPKQEQVAKQEVVAKGTNFRYIKTSSTFTPIKKSYFMDSVWFYILLLLPLCIIPLVVLINKKYQIRKGDVQGIKLRTANRLSKKYLSEAKKNLGNKILFYESLELALHNYLKAKLQIETSDISSENITEILKEKGVQEQTISHFMEVLKNCDFARYTPITDVEMQSEYEKATEVLTELDKEL